MLERFAQRLILVVAIVALAVGLFVIGYFGLLGNSAQYLTTKTLESLAKYYSAHKVVFDTTIFILGSVISISWGAFQVFKSWHYSEGQLPQRLLEFINNGENRFLDTRGAVLAAATLSKSDPHFLEPLSYTGKIREALVAFGFRDDRHMAKQLANAALRLEQEASAHRSMLSSIDAQLSSAFAARALYHAARAGDLKFENKNEEHELAIDYLLKAHALRPNDGELVWLLTRQCCVMGRDNDAIKWVDHFNELNGVSAVRRARALRLKAKSLCRRQSIGDLELARDALHQAIQLLDQRDLKKIELIERVHCLIALANVHADREKPRLTRQLHRRAVTAFTGLPEGEQVALRPDIVKLDSRVADVGSPISAKRIKGRQAIVNSPATDHPKSTNTSDPAPTPPRPPEGR